MSMEIVCAYVRAYVRASMSYRQTARCSVCHFAHARPKHFTGTLRLVLLAGTKFSVFEDSCI